MGKVYVFGASDGGPVKIGSSNEPEKRLVGVQIGNPVRLHILRTWHHPSASAIETASHRILKALRLQGEWFSVGTEAASGAIEQAMCNFTAHEEPTIIVPTKLKEDRLEARLAAIQRSQRKRHTQIETIQRKEKRRLTRPEIIRLELDGAFGAEWAEIRRSQGWEERLAARSSSACR